MSKYEVVFGGYVGDYEYDRTECTGSCDMYCRCSKIIHARVKRVFDGLSMIHVYENKTVARRGIVRNEAKLSIIQKYAIDRLFRIHGLFDVNKWEVKIISGYYGEEANGIGLIDKQLEYAFLHNVRTVLDMKDDIEVIRYVLLQEYKYIHDSIADATKCEVLELDSADLMRQQEHFSRVKHSQLDEYGMVEGLPIGIVYKGIRLIDGYHRLSIAGPGKHKFIVIS